MANRQPRFHRDGAAPGPGEAVFVFGSNEQGRHGLGAALLARSSYGARYGVGEGLCGQSYAIPTKSENPKRHADDRSLKTMTLEQIQVGVERFLKTASDKPHLEFMVTRVGCGLAGLRDCDIAPMFAKAPTNCTFAAAWAPFLPIGNADTEAVDRKIAFAFDGRSTPTG